MAGADFSADFSADFDQLISREWIAVNHIGGYACSTRAALNTRKYHGLLVASMAPPVRRMVLLSRVEETVVVGGRHVPLACSEYPGAIHPDGHTRLIKFSNDPFPRWAYQTSSFTVEKSLRLLAGQNTVVLSYTLLAGSSPAKLELRPLLALRGMHELSYQWNGRLEAQSRSAVHHRIPPTTRTPEVFFAHDEAGAFERNGCWYTSTIYRRECERGYAGLEDLWMPGAVRWTLEPGQTVHFVCSAEPIDVQHVVRQVESPPPVAKVHDDPVLAALLRAADQFVVRSIRAPINVTTQLPWSPPSGRDALIGFGGLFLVTGRLDDGLALLESMAAHLKDGMLPSEFPEDGSAPRYLGADTSLWFVNAVCEYLHYAPDDTAVRARLFDTILRVVRSYQAGTALGIRVDADGLLTSHEPGQATSWMDAKVGDWVITPRQGRTVELNALWYNALRIAADLCQRFGRAVWAAEFARLADSVKAAFNRRFWNELGGCCFDVITDRGADPSVRPNQLLAISLPHAVLAPERHRAVLEKVRLLLLTPVGVRTLSPEDPSYQGRYRGDVVSRDRAYHQGSAYPWLLGPLVRAMARTAGRAELRPLLDGCINHMLSAGEGQVCELFDGDAPHSPGGAVASARSVGVVLQAYVEGVLGLMPPASKQNAIALERTEADVVKEKAPTRDKRRR